MTTSPNDKVLTLFDGAGETGAALVDASDMVHPRIHPPPLKPQFWTRHRSVSRGSVPTGRKVAAAGQWPKPCFLELGGKVSRQPIHVKPNPSWPEGRCVN